MAQEWAEVPAYAAALDAVRGTGSLPGLLAEFEDARVSMQGVAETIGHRFGDLVAASTGDRMSAFNVANSGNVADSGGGL